MTSIEPFLARTHIAYFSMEIAIRPEMHTYSGGLGILAGDTARSCADLSLPIVFVTLLSREGYFHQEIDATGRQIEHPDGWSVSEFCTPLHVGVAIEIEGQPVWIRPWLYVHEAPSGHPVPILLLDTELDQNDEAGCALTRHLYGGDDTYRLKQEAVLGIGGCRLLRALGFDIRTYHLNEGHAALLTLDLLHRGRVPAPGPAREADRSERLQLRERCVFTTHTPIAAGHDRFSYELFERLLPGLIDLDALKRLAGDDCLNMTRLALNRSDYVNGVAVRHAETTRHMFPGYDIRAVTNGIHPGTWAHPAFAALCTAHVPRWHHEPEALVRAIEWPEETVWDAHQIAKAELIEHVRVATGTTFDQQVLTIGFARRMTGYKRPLLLFQDLDRLRAIAECHPLQLVLAGKAHPRDEPGKDAIQQFHELCRQFEGRLRAVYLSGYDMAMAKTLVAGCDVWLNTPLPPMEASGTSGMKAALNGVLNLSVLDGWWIEGCFEGITGWAIGHDDPAAADQSQAAEALYAKLEGTVAPLFYDDPARWRYMMKHAIALVGGYFNTHRMVRRYAAEAYLR